MFVVIMLQRLGLAQAMLHDPEVLILDEPTDGVDPVGRADIRETLFRLKEQGRTVLLNSHLLQEIELVADRVAVLNHGRLRHVGLINELTESDTSELVFELVADEATARAALTELTPSSVRSEGNGTTTISMTPDSQAEIDKAVDSIRQSGISIASMSRNHLTLEQAFLQLMSEEVVSPDLPDGKSAAVTESEDVA